MASKTVATIEPDDDIIEGEVVEYTDDVPANDDGTLAGSSGKTNKATANKITASMRSAAERFAESIGTARDAHDEVMAQLELGYDKNVHLALGYPSLTQWYMENAGNIVADALDADQRKQLAKSLNAKGVSIRAIAKGIGVDPSTISRDLEGEDKPDKVTGVDGREQSGKSKAKPKDDEPEEDSDEDEAEDEAPLVNPKAQFPPQFRSGIEGLTQAVALVDALAEDTRFAKASKKLAAELSEPILAATNSLLDLCDKLGIEVYEDEEAEATEDTEAEDEAEEFEEADEEAEDESAEDAEEFEEAEAEDEADESDDEDEDF